MGLLNATYVKKCFPFPVYLEDIKHLMLERRRPMNVNNAIDGLVPPLHFIIMKEVIMGKSPTPVNNVVKFSVVPVIFGNMNELMLGKNPIHANSVVSVSVLPVLFRYMKECILEKSPINVNKVLEHSVAPLALGNVNKLRVGGSPMTIVWKSLCFQLELIANISYVNHNGLMNVNSGKSVVSLTGFCSFLTKMIKHTGYGPFKCEVCEKSLS